MQHSWFQRDPKQTIVIAVTVEMSHRKSLVLPYSINLIIFLGFVQTWDSNDYTHILV